MTHPIAEEIRKSNDFVEAVNLIAQKYSREENVPDIVHDTINGIIKIKKETNRQYLNMEEFKRSVQRNVPKTSRNCPIHEEMFNLKARAEQSGTKIFPTNKQMQVNQTSDTKVFRKDEYENSQTSDTKVFRKDEYENN